MASNDHLIRTTVDKILLDADGWSATFHDDLKCHSTDKSRYELSRMVDFYFATPCRLAVCSDAGPQRSLLGDTRIIDPDGKLVVMDDTWISRDFPVLEAAVRLYEELWPAAVPDGSDIVDATKLSKEDVARSLNALKDVYLDVTLTMSGGDPSPWAITKVYPRARTAVGQWPTAESVLDKLIAGLEDAAEGELDAEKRSKLRNTASWLGAGLRGTAENVLGTVIARSMGLG